MKAHGIEFEYQFKDAENGERVYEVVVPKGFKDGDVHARLVWGVRDARAECKRLAAELAAGTLTPCSPHSEECIVADCFPLEDE